MPAVEAGYYLLKLSPTLRAVLATAVASPSTQVNALQVDGAGDLIVGTAVADFAADAMHPVLEKYSGKTLESVWTTVMGHEAMPALIYGLTVLPDGRIVAAGLYSRTLVVGSFVLEKPQDVRTDDFVYNGWVGWFGADDGKPSLADTFGGSVSDSASDALVTASGSLRLLTAHSGGMLSLFGTSVDLGEHVSALVDLDASGNSVRVVPFGMPKSSSVEMALGPDGQTYVVGRYGDPFGDLSTQGALLTRIGADGTPGASLSLSTGHSATHLAVDTQGGVWIAGSSEAPLVWTGQTYEPMPTPETADNGCRLLMRLKDF